MCIIFSTAYYEVDGGLTHVGRQYDMKGMLWVLDLKQVIPTEAGQGSLQEGNHYGTISDQSGILTQILLEPFSRPTCLGLTSINSFVIMCVWALGQAVQTLSH